MLKVEQHNPFHDLDELDVIYLKPISLLQPRHLPQINFEEQIKVMLFDQVRDSIRQDRLQ